MLHYQRMIAQHDRDCSRCEDPISDGEVFVRVEAFGEDWCLTCEAYERDREREA